MKPITNSTLYAHILCFLILCASYFVKAQVFMPSIVPDEIFPLPTRPSSSGTTGAPGPYTVVRPPYDDRFRGACLYAHEDFNRDGTVENLKLWTSTWNSITGVGSAIAFEIAEEGASAPKHTGFYCYSSWDMSNLQIGYTYAIAENGGGFKDYFDVWAAYWAGSTYYLDRFQLDPDATSPTAGLTRISSTPLTGFTIPNGKPLSLYTNVMSRTGVVAWEEPSGIHLKGFSSAHGVSSTGIYKISANYLIPGTAGCTVPDVGVEYASWSGGSDWMVHTVCVNPSTKQIIKGVMGLTDLMNCGGPVFPPTSPHPYVVQDIENISVYNPANDGFQLKLALRREVYTTHDMPWAYTYYNDDGNKIRLRIQPYRKPTDAPAAPITYTLNDGSLGNGDIATNFGNAFPTLAYIGEKLTAADQKVAYNQIIVGWYTTYDPAKPGGNYLYEYSGGSKRYVAVKITEDPALAMAPVITDYMEISDRYTTNDVGVEASFGAGLPFIAFSPRNDTHPYGKLFCTFGGYGTTDIYDHPLPIVGNSYSFPADPPLGPVISTQSAYIANKLIDDPYTKSGFKPLNIQEEKTTDLLDVYPTVFSNTTKFRLTEKGATSTYEAALTSIDGKKISMWKGTIAEINTAINKTDFSTSSTGIFLLTITSPAGQKRYFKLIKE